LIITRNQVNFKGKSEMQEENANFSSQLSDSIMRSGRRMNVEIDESRLEALSSYALELMRWNKAYNMIGRRLGKEGIIELFVDAISPLCIKGLFDGKREIIDIGSGAGLPGIPIYMIGGPFTLTLVESQRKKVTFLRHIKRMLEIDDMRIFSIRFEELARQEDNLNAYEVGLARAVMDPIKLAISVKPIICDGGKIVLFVGKGEADRIRKASPGLSNKGLNLENLRSTQRIVGKEHYLAVIEKRAD
jgi:16S rRNA (guanine527-N7)-methyltransferase